MRIHSLLFVLVATCPSFAQEAVDPVVRRIVDTPASESHVMRYLDDVANKIGPRLTGSDGYMNACNWARDEFEAIGLTNVRLERWGEFPVGFNRGPASGRMTKPLERELRFFTNAWTAGTKGKVSGIAVFAPTNAEELEAVRPKLAGAWVVAKSAAPGSARGNGAGAGGGPGEGGARGGAGAGGGPGPGGDAGAGANRASDRAFREARDKAYDEAGIAGTIRGTRGELVVTGGSQRVDWNKLPTRPSIQMVAADHAAIVEKLEANEEVRLEFDIRNHFERGPIQLHNVIADLVGSEKPDEYVIVGGHLDSWDGATGALDNGTGVATTMEAARLLVTAGARPKRTIRFMLWGGEEQGLLGSRAWIEQNPAELPRISAVLVHDGGTNYCAGIPATELMVPLFERIFAPVVGLDREHPFRVRRVKGISSVGSDSDAFLSVGVPGHFWDQKGRSNYTHVHHTQFDTYEEAIAEYQRNSSAVIAVGALGIANLPDLLPREGLRPVGTGGGRRRLGVQLDDEMRIEELTDGGIAAKVGMRVGDRVTKIGEMLVADREELVVAMQEAPLKTKATVMRGTESVEFEIEFPVDLDAPIRRYGMRVNDDLEVDRLTKDEIASKAGIAMGDLIQTIDGKPVKTKAEFSAALEAAKDAVRLELRRGDEGKHMTVTVTLARPEPR